MKKTDQEKILTWFKDQNITNVGDKFYINRKKKQAKDNYVILNFETLSFSQVENLDLCTVQIYVQDISGSLTIEEIGDSILELFSGERKDFGGFEVYQVLPTTRTPTFTLKGQYKLTLFFQIRYLI